VPDYLSTPARATATVNIDGASRRPRRRATPSLGGRLAAIGEIVRAINVTVRTRSTSSRRVPESF
jgi:hypothetical protein